jgi:hypothetical protein
VPLFTIPYLLRRSMCRSASSFAIALDRGTQKAAIHRRTFNSQGKIQWHNV